MFVITPHADSVPPYVATANRCAIAASMLAAALGTYYALVALGWARQAPMGLLPIWTAAIIILAMVKVQQVMADGAARQQIRHQGAEMDAMHDALETLTITVNELQERVDAEILLRSQAEANGRAVKLGIGIVRSLPLQ
jgi:hypothetical protein